MLFYLNHQKNLKILLILKMTEKSTEAYKTIGEVVKILDLKSRTGQKTPTHTIRFWEKEFKQIKPKILNNNRRYYDKSSNSKDLDEISNKTIRTDNLKNKINKISNIIKELKKLK